MIRKACAGALIAAVIAAGAGCGGGGDDDASAAQLSGQWTAAARELTVYCDLVEAGANTGIDEARAAIDAQLALVRADPDTYREPMIDQLVAVRRCNTNLADYGAVYLREIH